MIRQINFWLNHDLRPYTLQPEFPIKLNTIKSVSWMEFKSLRKFISGLDFLRQMINMECVSSNIYGVSLPSQIQLLRVLSQSKSKRAELSIFMMRSGTIMDVCHVRLLPKFWF